MQSAFVICVVVAIISGCGLGIHYGVKKSKNTDESTEEKLYKENFLAVTNTLSNYFSELLFFCKKSG